jgi:hypothetical protein
MSNPYEAVPERVSDIPALDNPDKDENFDHLRRIFSRLESGDFDERGYPVFDAGCEGCPITHDVLDANASGDAKAFDPNERWSLARMMIEDIYRKCPARPRNQVTGWKALWQRVTNTENLYLTQTRGRKPGTYFACGLDRDTPVETVDKSNQ